MDKALIISCEHGGNQIPENYKHLFQGHDDVLKTHRGYDIGALELAKQIKCQVETSFFFTEISRLFVEVNRSVGHPQLFSEFTAGLPEAEKEAILKKYYYPYRDQIERAVAWHSANGHQVFHLSIHTFTPELDGKKRNADIGILYDPSRKVEKDFSDALQNSLERSNSGLVVKHNYPYEGTDDGLTTTLRKTFPDVDYCGIEIEINQKFAERNDPASWHNLKAFIESCICQVIRDSVHPGLVNVGKVA